MQQDKITRRSPATAMFYHWSLIPPEEFVLKERTPDVKPQVDMDKEVIVEMIEEQLEADKRERENTNPRLRRPRDSSRCRLSTRASSTLSRPTLQPSQDCEGHRSGLVLRPRDCEGGHEVESDVVAAHADLLLQPHARTDHSPDPG